MAMLLTASAVLPMEEADRRRLLQPGAVLVDGGVIAAVGPPETFEGIEAERVDLAGRALIPGLHNCSRTSGESGHVLADASSLLEATLDRGAEVDSAVQPGDGRLLRGRRERAKRAWG